MSDSSDGTGPGHRRRPASPAAYAALDRAHKAMAKRLAKEEHAIRVGAKLVDPTFGPPASEPAVVTGNDWVARSRAYAYQIHISRHGAFPQLVPGGSSSPLALPMAPAPGRVQEVAVQSPSNGQPKVDPDALSAASRPGALRVGAASLSEQQPDGIRVGVTSGPPAPAVVPRPSQEPMAAVMEAAPPKVQSEIVANNLATGKGTAAAAEKAAGTAPSVPAYSTRTVAAAALETSAAQAPPALAGGTNAEPGPMTGPEAADPTAKTADNVATPAGAYPVTPEGPVPADLIHRQALAAETARRKTEEAEEVEAPPATAEEKIEHDAPAAKTHKDKPVKPPSTLTTKELEVPHGDDFGFDAGE